MMAENMMNSAHKSSNKEYRAGYDAVKWDKEAEWVSFEDFMATATGQAVFKTAVKKGIPLIDFGIKMYNSADGRKP